MILVDSSGSITDADPGNWERVKQLLRMLVNVIDEDSEISVTSRVAIYRYSNLIDTPTTFEDDRNRDQLIDVIDNMRIIGGFTHMYTAVRMAAEYLQQSARRVSGEISATQAIILFTDGKPCENGRKYMCIFHLLEALCQRLSPNIFLRES